MKKLIMFGIAVMACSIVSAATFNWGTETTANALNTGEDGYASVGTMYYLYAVGAETATITSFNKDTQKITIGGTEYSSVDSHELTSTEYDNGSFKKQYMAAADSINQNYYVVLFDSDTAGNVGSAMFTVSGITEQSTSVNYSSVIDNAGLGTASSMTIPVTSGGSSSDVPEPTSGLLLVLGGAMLALRRRRA